MKLCQTESSENWAIHIHGITYSYHSFQFSINYIWRYLRYIYLDNSKSEQRPNKQNLKSYTTKWNQPTLQIYIKNEQKKIHWGLGIILIL